MSRRHRSCPAPSVPILALAAGLVTLAGCEPLDQDTPAPATDVVVSAGTARSGDHTTHTVGCGNHGDAEYLVVVPADRADSYRAGDPCPQGPHRPLPSERYPELHQRMRDRHSAPLPYHGGDPDSLCGSWATDDKHAAALMRARTQKCRRLGDPSVLTNQDGASE